MNKSVGMLGLALLCGLGAMYGTIKLISKDKAPAAEKQDVLVAVRDLKIEEVIKPDLVRVVQMDKSAVPMGAFSSIKDVEDRWVQVATLEGEPLVDRKLAAKGSPPGLISRIPKGMRAFAIDVNEQSGVSGFVLPDHRVDVVQIEQGPPGQTQAEAVLQDVLVLASGQTFTRPEDRAIQARTVTLAVTPEQVDILVAAKQKGSLTLALRGVNDHEHVAVKKKEMPALKEKERPPLGRGEVPVAAMPTPPPACRRHHHHRRPPRRHRRPPRSTSPFIEEARATSNASASTRQWTANSNRSARTRTPIPSRRTRSPRRESS